MKVKNITTEEIQEFDPETEIIVLKKSLFQYRDRIKELEYIVNRYRLSRKLIIEAIGKIDDDSQGVEEK